MLLNEMTKAKSKKEQLQDEIAKAVGAGRAVSSETVDFADPNRPKTCLEVDFPILPINQVAVIEGNAGKPIYQMSKWWARRRSSVFRSMLIAAATKAPSDPAQAAKAVWDAYYANHQKKGSFKNIKVADIFMGGGTTLVEGSRLGMQLSGVDLNPVAWFVVKQELAKVDLDEVKRLLADIEAEVKPQIMPFYYCDGPNGEKGKWTHLPSGKVMGADFDPLSLKSEERKDYKYEGPEIIYTFWAKHGPCQVTGCGHRTPIMSSPVMAVKTLTVKSWEHSCEACHAEFDVEDKAARMAPDVPLYVAPSEKPFTVMNINGKFACPNCGHKIWVKLGKSKNKKVEMSLLVHPEWLAGSPNKDFDGKPFGGSAQDDAESTSRWNLERASKIRLLEVRGELPDEVTCPKTKITFKTGKEGGTVPKRSNYACGACGTTQDVLATVRASGKTGPMASYAVQGYAPEANKRSETYNGRFFAPFNEKLAKQYNAALSEWDSRKNDDLAKFWPKSSVPFGFMTAMNNGDIRLGHGFTHWWTMFNPRQLLVHAQLLKAIITVGNYEWETREYALGALQQYLRNQSLFTLWNVGADKLEPMFANNNYHPKSTVIENCVFGKFGRGNWNACAEGTTEGLEWAKNPWETVSVEMLRRVDAKFGEDRNAKSEKTYPHDQLNGAQVFQGSSTELKQFTDNSVDLVITDPPFGGLLHYSELSDFFYVWLRLALKEKYPDIFEAELTPKSLEVVANRAREPEDPDGFYQRLLTQCWTEAHRILKPGGILAFTFHHSEDKPWVAVLKSLFDSGFYLEATYPIRSDETKGEGSQPGTFGSQQIEYDIVHVCRKRTEAVKPVSWAKMRREVLDDIRQLQGILEQHTKDGLPTADLRVIKIGKALEYYSKHYGQVFVDDGQPLEVKDALIGIELLMQEDPTSKKEYPPSNAEPATQQFLRIFNEQDHIARDQIQKFMKGTGMDYKEFANRGWCYEEDKIYHLEHPKKIAQSWYGRHREKMKHDYDQVIFMIGACFEGSGINVQDTLKNERFKPHPATKGLLEWHSRHAGIVEARVAAIRALEIYKGWERQNQDQVQQMSLFFEG